MRIEILEEAERDLIEGFHFYENQAPGLGLYFRTNLFADIEALRITQAFTASLTSGIIGYYPEVSLRHLLQT
jgi:hypothetical protein